LKLYHTRKPVYISTVLWFHNKIAGIVRAKSIPTAFLVVVYLQTIRYNQLLSNNNVFRLKKGMNLADVKNLEEVDTKETNKSMAFAVFRGYQRLRTPQEICYGTIELGREPGAQYSLDCN